MDDAAVLQEENQLRQKFANISKFHEDVAQTKRSTSARRG